MSGNLEIARVWCIDRWKCIDMDQMVNPQRSGAVQ
jgi:hypothetical protein